MSANGQKAANDRETPANATTSAWRELRDLLTKPEQSRLDDLEKRLGDPFVRAEEISRVLPDAIVISTESDQRISRVLQPTIDSALRDSVRKNPKALADAIYPSLGPAIRRAISATLMSMIQSLNQVLNQSFSLQGIRWRYEAARTKRPLAEIVLLHSLVYRVEQIFLIHGQTGIVLQHVASAEVAARDPDMVSGMLTAIQDFVGDSFKGDSEEQLDTLRMSGDHSVWIERGSGIFLAAVIRGTPPMNLRQRFSELIDSVQKNYKSLLENFDGRPSSFAILKPQLEDLLAFQVKKKRARISPLLWIASVVVVIGIFFWTWQHVRTKQNWQHYLVQLRGLNGIVVTAVKSYNGGYLIEGFKDALAQDPESLFSTTNPSPGDIVYHWEPYYCLDNEFVLKRAQRRLHPPNEVSLHLNNGIISARGQAPHRWIVFFRRQVSTLPGVAGYDDTDLQDIEKNDLKNIVRELEKKYLLFDQGKATLENSHEKTLTRIVVLLRRIDTLCRTLNASVKIALMGHADPSGARQFNVALSKQRAENTYRYFLDKGIQPLLLAPIGAGIRSSLTADRQMPSNHKDRSVTFFVSINESEL